jgi:long-chain acyl-CoA synthetase
MREEIENLLADSGAKIIIISSELVKLHKFSIKSILMEEVENFKASKIPAANILPDDLAAIIYTSGTTGVPKGVMLTHENIVSNFVTTAKLFKLGPGDNFLSVLPLHHTFEATAGFLGPFYMGCTITYAESLKSHNLLTNMQETGVTIMCGVPLLYNLFYQGILREVEEKGPLAGLLFSGLIGISKALPFAPIRRKMFSMIHKKLGGKIRFWVSGGAAIDPEIIRGFEVFGITILQGYGLTESAPILACCTLENNRIGSVGKPLSNVELKLTPEGEIIAKGPNIMKGYYKRDDLTEEVIKDGWLYTGDIGRIDEHGYVYITGRIKDIIVTGSGVNVYPDEIEFFLNKLPGVKESCVLGIKIKEGVRRGMEEVWAVLVPDIEYFKKKNIAQDKAEKIIKEEIDKLNEKLTEYKRIANVIIKNEDLPKTTTRKVKRFQVRKEMNI